MALNLISSPIRTVYNLFSTNVVGMLAQIPFDFKRVDEVRSFVADGVSFVDLTTMAQTGDPVLSESIGNVWYIDFPEGSPYKAGAYPIKEIRQSGATDWEISFNILFVSNIADVDVNFITTKSNYSIEITVFDRSGVTELIENPIRFKPRQNGSLFIDLAGLLVGRVVQNRDTQFRVQYSEHYNGENFSAVLYDPIIGLIGRKQFLETGGSNMWDYLANQQDKMNVRALEESGSNRLNIVMDAVTNIANYTPNVDFLYLDIPPYVGYHLVANTNLGFTFIEVYTDWIGGATNLKAAGLSLGKARKVSGRFLTDFIRPKMWNGYLRTISYVLDDKLQNRTGYTDISVQTIGKDAAGGVIATQEGANSTTGIHEFGLAKIEGAVTQEVSMFWSPDIFMSETIIFDVEEPCKNPVMIEWVNNLGGLEQQLFQVNQAVESTSEKGLVFDQAVQTTYDLANDTIGRLSYVNRQNVILVAEKLTVNYAKSLAQMKLSPVVWVWLDNTGQNKIEVIVVNDFKFNYQTNDELVDYDITIQMPQNFDLFK